MKSSNTLGEELSCNFGIGDIVSWKRLNKEINIGMIYNIYNIEMGGRQIKKASIASFKDTLHYDILIIELKLVSKGNKK